MRPRVKRPKNYEALLNLLTEEKKGPFESFKDALVFCAALGLYKNKRVQFEKTSEPINLDIFNKGDEAFIFMLGIHSNDMNLLLEENLENRLNIFEEYANGGLGIVSEKAQDRTREISEHIEEFILDMFEVKNEKGSNITSIASEFK